MGRAIVVSPKEYQSRYPTGKIPTKNKEHGKVFICRRGCNTRTATFTEEFVWEDIYRGPEDLQSLRDRIEKETKATRKRKVESKPPRYDDFIVEEEEDDIGPKTPSKRRKTDAATTPKSAAKARTPRKFTTPTHKRY